MLKVKYNFFMYVLALRYYFYSENTENPNSPETQQILQSEPQTWKESFYKFYLRANRSYKIIIYYTWRFAEIHSYKFVLLIMVLVSVLKVK
jgi:hypothetical protein